jgi:uncharacterized protein
MSKTIVLYHANCYDGFGSAYAAWKHFGARAQYVPMNYGDPLPEFSKGDTVYMVDYSRKRDEVERVAETCDLTIIDHHKTAQADLEGLPYATFDMTKSGAVLTWIHFNQAEYAFDGCVPMLLQHIQDRDLWQFKLDGTKEVHAALCSYPFDFEIWDSFTVDALKERGKAVLSYHDVLVDRFCAQAYMGEIGGYQVPIVNVSLLFSEVPHKLLRLYPEAPFAAYFYYRKDGVCQYGLRGRGDFDVSAVAKQFGGGGHHNAAGFEIRN